MNDFTRADLDAVMFCIKYTAEHKYKKDPIRQCMLAEIADKVEELFSCFASDTDENFLTEEETDDLFNKVDFLKNLFETFNRKDEGDNNG